MLEKEMYEPVKKWLVGCGFEPKAEVKGCDIMAVRDDLVLAVELKTVLNLEVILQATDRQRFSDIVYIAVPKKGRLFFTKRWRMITHLLRRLEIGLLLVSPKGGEETVEESIQPVPFDRVKSRQLNSRKRKVIVKEYQDRHGDHNIGGSNKSRLVTVYREQSLVIADLLAEYGPMSPKALRERGANKDKAAGILRNNHYGWFAWLSKGLYGITDEGRKALENYHEVVAELKAEYEAKERQADVSPIINQEEGIQGAISPQEKKKEKKSKGKQRKRGDVSHALNQDENMGGKGKKIGTLSNP